MTLHTVDKIKESTFMDRLLFERDELVKRHEKLNDFFDTMGFTNLPTDQRELLLEQYEIMLKYEIVLNQRIELING